ncbi:MAG: FAD:protein FMN transferase [Candidatus Krumholzibacteria bacterium]|nr:FAD:protein FMN transferase [Candidatus Krumholzibacteria bacterium]
MKTRFLIAAALLLQPHNGCAPSAVPLTRETFVMGTKCVITIYGMDDRRAGEAAGRAIHELHRIETVMSTWNADSEISALNGSPGNAPFAVSRELFGILDESFRWSELTGGAFDITARPLVRMWGFQGGEAVLPSGEEISAALRLVGFGKVRLDAENLAVERPEGMQFDLAGIGKGYGVDRCVAILRESGVESALVNLGGNMYALGAPPGKGAWTIGIRDPRGGDGLAGRLLLKDEAVATSGNYENFVVIDGKRRGHIVDPRSGLTVDGQLSVTVTAPTATAADALSTGLFVLGPVEGPRAAENIPGVRAVFLLENGERVVAGDFGDSLDFGR